MDGSARDLNKNGVLDPYEAPRRPVEERVEDLLGQLRLAEKAGLMFHDFIATSPDGQLVEGPAPRGPYPETFSTRHTVVDQAINHFCVLQFPPPRQMAEWVNRIQKLAETESRLGIPVTISSNPIHGYDDNPATGTSGEFLSRWPEPLGFGAIGDESVVQEFGDIARQEYVALGIRVALPPMADLATDPRWARTNGCFTEDAVLSSQIIRGYIRGFQGETLGAHSVACMTKHFPGAGPQQDGEDAHFSYGREQVYPGANADYHLAPFEAAIAAGTSSMLPYYGMPVGTDWEEVGFAFNADVISKLLRETMGFDRIVCTDFKIIEDHVRNGEVFIEACCWGVEDLSARDRVRKIIDAGCDQIGGDSRPELVVELVEAGLVSEDRIDVSLRRILREKFELGLFDDPYVDVDEAVRIPGKPEFRQAGARAQRLALTLLKNEDELLPLSRDAKIYVEGVDPTIAATYGAVVDRPEAADVALIRLKAPYELRSGSFLESRFHAGDLDFKEPELSRILSLLEEVPTVVDIYLDRPAVIPEIADRSAALLANYGAEDEAVLDVVFGRAAPKGRLPFELPSSMDAVRAQREDVPYDSADPLFNFGEGLTYAFDL